MREISHGLKKASKLLLLTFYAKWSKFEIFEYIQVIVLKIIMKLLILWLKNLWLVAEKIHNAWKIANIHKIIHHF